ncbi:hypothetical protein AYI69_g11437 [Smittium culicis]|uniref:VPS37 C-terminal domain-containing protein n=1 Tax=Smittium culicis TaxID=133412 RepID=A0A1R1WYU8_9FUNG|nr:hypothetical protein AYI69_g11437 [Smittium culicis]
MEDLQDLLKFNDLFQAHFDGLDQVQMTRTLQYELRQQSLQLAEANLHASERIASLRASLADSEAEAKLLQQEYFESSNKVLEVQRMFFKRSMIEKLALKRDSAEAATEKLVEEFLAAASGSGSDTASADTGSKLKSEDNIESFLNDFIKKRSLYHQLSAKHELIMNNRLV